MRSFSALIILRIFHRFRFIWGGIHERSVQLYVAQDQEWNEVTDENKLVSVYAWNRIDVDENTYQMDLIFPDEEAIIGEIVCLNDAGEIITPINADEYPELFDEQDTFKNPPTYYEETMFDEVYHSRTAYEFLNEMAIYENTHPPLGKAIIALGIRIFGMNPFGYRIMCLLFGTLLVPVLYLFVRRITGRTSYALLSGVLLSTEFMHYTLSRIGTIDVIVALFVMLMFYGIFAFIQEEKVRYLIVAGMASALGIATKWTACYAIVALAIIIFVWMAKKWGNRERLQKQKKDVIRFILICAGLFVLLPVGVYVLSYIPFARVYPDQTIIGHAVSNSVHMLTYHASALDPHPYSSPWYLWLIDWVPLLDSWVETGDKLSLVVTFANPLVCILGLLSIVHHIKMTLIDRKRTAAMLLLFYLSMLVPWFFIARTVFIYQYFICLLVLNLMICNSILHLHFVKEKRVLVVTGAASIGLFLLFFPMISGLAVSRNYMYSVLGWLPRWKF